MRYKSLDTAAGMSNILMLEHSSQKNSAEGIENEQQLHSQNHKQHSVLP